MGHFANNVGIAHRKKLGYKEVKMTFGAVKHVIITFVGRNMYPKKITMYRTDSNFKKVQNEN